MSEKFTIKDLDADLNKPAPDTQTQNAEVNTEDVEKEIIKGEIKIPEVQIDNFYEVVKSKFTSIEEFNKYLEDADKAKMEAETLRSKYSEVETKSNEFQKKLQEYEELGYIDNETYYKLAKLEKTNPEKAKKVAKVLFGNVSPTELLRMKVEDDYPMYADSNDYITAMLEEEYGINKKLPDEDDDNYHEALQRQKVKEIKQTKEAESYKDKILGELSSIEIPKPKTKVDGEKERQEYIESWKTPFKQLSNELSEFVIKTKSEEGEDNLFSVSLNEGDKEKYLKPIVDVIMSGRYETTPETIKNLKEMAEKEYFYDNREKIIMEAIGRAKKEGFEYYRKKTTGDAVKNTEKAPKATVTDPKLAFFNAVMGR